ncbi:MAG: hypothetical protein BJ554DRAFT_1512 [Olpidium bornovanus]|uniref:Uncharacterized protein n=1 Tax=Olpidium bornovanus TaxID=278681 RepID=A0A8H8A1U3_9FUNG|nr:MAG: hypothetical protein BJ554DRAFT_1512 [Olpidium bornovanus]
MILLGMIVGSERKLLRSGNSVCVCVWWGGGGGGGGAAGGGGGGVCFFFFFFFPPFLGGGGGNAAGSGKMKTRLRVRPAYSGPSFEALLPRARNPFRPCPPPPLSPFPTPLRASRT